MSNLRKAIEGLIEHLERQNDFDDEFYQTYCLGKNDGDISDWHDSHFDDNVELGFSTGETSMAHDIVIALNEILSEDSE